jgi:hypothetical protein
MRLTEKLEKEIQRLVKRAYQEGLSAGVHLRIQNPEWDTNFITPWYAAGEKRWLQSKSYKEIK